MPFDQEFLSPGPGRGNRPDQPAAAPIEAVPRAGQAVAVTLPGEIDLMNASEVSDALVRALEGGAAVVIADATGTTFCDCAGVRALLCAHCRAAAAGTTLRVAAATSGRVHRVLELTGADQVLDVYPTMAAARANLPVRCSSSRPKPTSVSSTRGSRPRPA